MREMCAPSVRENWAHLFFLDNKASGNGNRFYFRLIIIVCTERLKVPGILDHEGDK